MRTKSTTYLYWKIYSDIITQIKEGKLTASDKIAREVDLAVKYSVSRSTMRKALDYLCRMNLIYRVKKGGTFINGKLFSNELYKIIPTVLPFTEELHSELVAGIQTNALAFNSFSPVYDSASNAEREREILESIYEMGADGLIVYPCVGLKNLDIIYRFKNAGIPIIFIDRRMPGTAFPLVTSNNIDGMSSAVEHLISLGHRDIAFFAINTNCIPPEQERLQGYLETLTAHGITVKQEHIFRLENLSERLVNFTPKQQFDYYNRIVKKNFAQLLSSLSPPTAITFLNDHLAINFIKYLSSQPNASIDSFAITGFDDVLNGKTVVPSLTTVRQSFFNIGKVAIDNVIKCIHKESVPQTSYIETELIIRDSSKTAHLLKQ